MNFLNDFRRRNAQRAAYNRTVREIRGMDTQTAIDLGIYQGDAEKIAHQAVYGA